LTPNETWELGPFDLSRGLPPDQVDLENAIYEPVRVQRKYARPVARQLLEDLDRQACQAYVPVSCRNLQVNVRLAGMVSEPVLVPVWIMAYTYRSRVFRFLINGQSGKATGHAPTSWSKVTLLILGVLLAIVLMILLANLG
jgi:hypothetical protein